MLHCLECIPFFRNWAPGEPNNLGQEHYAEFVPDRPSWNDGAADGGHALHGFLCGPISVTTVLVQSSLTVNVMIEEISSSIARYTFMRDFKQV